MRQTESTIIQAKALASGFPGGSPARAGSIAGPTAEPLQLAMELITLGNLLFGLLSQLEDMPQRLQLSRQDLGDMSREISGLKNLMARAKAAADAKDQETAALLVGVLNAYSLAATRMAKLLWTRTEAAAAGPGSAEQEWKQAKDAYLQEMRALSRNEEEECKTE